MLRAATIVLASMAFFATAHAQPFQCRAQLEGKKDRQGVDHAQQAFGNMVVYATGRR